MMKIQQSIFYGSSTGAAGKRGIKAPEYAFIGRSNVGKSSLINMLCGQKNLAHTSSMPGKTIMINHFLINGKWFLVDLPGYGFAKTSKKRQEVLKKMIEDYVGHSEDLAVLFILVDSRHPLQEIDRNFISAVADACVPFAVIMTKCDKLSKAAAERNMKAMAASISEIRKDITIIPSSSEKGTGRDDILSYIESSMNSINNNSDTLTK